MIRNDPANQAPQRSGRRPDRSDRVEPDELLPPARGRSTGVSDAAPGEPPRIGNDREKLAEWLPDRWERREAERLAAASGVGSPDTKCVVPVQSAVIPGVIVFVLRVCVAVQTSGKLWYLGATGSTADINVLQERFERVRSTAAPDSAVRVHNLEAMQLDIVIAMERGFDPAQARLDYLDRTLSSDPSMQKTAQFVATKIWPPAPAAAAMGDGDLRIRRLEELQRRIRELIEVERAAALVLAQGGAEETASAFRDQRH